MAERRVNGALWATGTAAVLLALVLCGVAALTKSFSIDEFQYAHAAWLVAHGAAPYRDFFESHFPLVYLALAPLSRLLGSAPLAQLLGFRSAMLVACAVALGALVGLTRGLPLWARVLAPLVLGSLEPWLHFAVEVRPDAVGSACFLLALAFVLAAERRISLTRPLLGDAALDPTGDAVVLQRAPPLVPLLSRAQVSFLGGLAAGVAFWGTQKVAVAELCLLVPLATGAVHRRGFLLGGVLGLAPVAGYLQHHGDWQPFWHWCFAWAAEHERGYPPLRLSEYLGPVLLAHSVLFALALLGIGASLRRERPELLLPLAFLTTLGSIVFQRAAFPYSYLAFLGVSVALALRGCVRVSDGLRVWPVLRVVALVGGVVTLSLHAAQTKRLLAEDNQAQRNTLRKVGRLTNVTDVAYDNSGGFISRPHVGFYFYTDAFLRGSLAGQLERDLPHDLLAAGAVLHLRDLRLSGLPATSQRFLSEHYQPYDGDISLWGQHFDTHGDAPWTGVFLAVKTDRYFAGAPGSAWVHGALTVDGVPLGAEPVLLEAGPHVLRYTGPQAQFDILWLPRNEERWQPQHGLPGTFSRLL